MVTEGTYPQAFGGVSVWCDQLLRGLHPHTFDVYAIGVTGKEPHAWELPSNVTVHSVPLWGPPVRPPRRGRRAEIGDAYRLLLESLVAPGGAGVPMFTAALQRLSALAADGPIPATTGDAPVGWRLNAWQASPLATEVAIRPSILDAMTCVDIIGHWLRPLLRPTLVADITHAVTNGLAALPALAAKWQHGVPLLLTEHGVYLRERYLGLRTVDYSWPVKVVLLAFQRLLCAIAYRASDLITPGNKYNHRWETRFGAAPERIRTVYNGVDPADFPHAGPEPDVPTLTWAGRVDPIKDLETLIRAFALVKKEIPDCRLRLFGGTPAGSRGYQKRCVALAAELGVGDDVVFEGRVADIRDAYTAGNVVMLSSISEGFPYTLIEAMTSGRATISTDVGGVAEAAGDTGVVVPPREPAAMAEAAVRLLRDDTERLRLGMNARARALQLFTLDQAIEAFDGIYNQLGRRRLVDAPRAFVPQQVKAGVYRSANHRFGAAAPWPRITDEALAAALAHVAADATVVLPRFDDDRTMVLPRYSDDRTMALPRQSDDRTMVLPRQSDDKTVRISVPVIAGRRDGDPW